MNYDDGGREAVSNRFRRSGRHDPDFGQAIAACVMAYLCIVCIVAFPTAMYNGDEGFYAACARNVARGLRPYRDFFFVQMPLVLYAYAGWFSLWGASITSGRVLSVLMTIVAIVLTMVTCRRRAGFWPAVVAGLLWSTGLYTVWDLSLIKTQALSNLLICAAVFCVPEVSDRRLLARAAASMALMTLAMFTRLTLVVPLVLLWGLLAWQCRRRRAEFAVLVCCNLVLVWAAWSWFRAGDRMWFGVYLSHKAVFGNAPWTWVRLGMTVKQSIGNQLVLAGLLVLAVIRFAAAAVRKEAWSDLAFPAYLIASYAGVTAAHWAQVQNYATHQTVITGFAVVFVAVMLGPLIDRVVSAGRLQAAAAWLGFVALSLPFSEASDLYGIAVARADRDSLSRAGEALRPLAKPGDRILGFNPELAVNGGYDIYPGCELSTWGYLGDMPEELARRYRVLTFAELRDALVGEKAPIITATQRDFAHMAMGRNDVAAELKGLLDRHYDNAAVVEKYGHFGDKLFILKRKRNVP